MNGRGGCCIARYAGGGGGGGGGMYMSKVDRIMLKFRPIAPKPVAAGSGTGGSATENSDGYVKCGRGKRKYVRVNGNKNKKKSSKGCSAKKGKVPASSSPPPPQSDAFSGGGDAVVTLSLLPETPDRKEKSPFTSSPSGNSDLLSSVRTTKKRKCSDNSNNKSAPAPVWLSFNNQQQTACYRHVPEESRRVVSVSDHAIVMIPPPAPPPPRRPQVVSYVTVECVTDTWVNGEPEVDRTDEERVMNMERDTCPVFISDGRDRVVWTNKAYKEMAGVGHVSGGEEIAVVLVRKDKWTTPTPITYPAFTCKVRVTSGTQSHRTTPSPPSSTLTLPCDAWRMEGGGYAWRLDVEAALSLGR